MALTLNPNWPLCALQGAFNTDPNTSTAPSWVDLSRRLNSWDTHLGRSYELNTVETGTSNWQLNNKDEYLNPANLSSPFNQAVTPGLVPGQVAVANTAAGTSNALGLTLPNAATAGNWLLILISCNQPAVTPAGFTPITAGTVVTASNGSLYLFVREATGGEQTITLTPNVADVFSAAMLEYQGLTFVLPMIDQAVTAHRSASSSASQGTGVTGTTGQPLELAISVAAPHNYAAASAPTGPAWSSGATQRVSTATTSATTASNAALFVADRVLTATGTVTDTCTWTNASADASAMVITLKAVLTLVPYRRLRYWEAARPDGTAPLWSGNFLNSGNDSAWASSGTAQHLPNPTFDTNTTDWWGNGGTLSQDAVTVHSGTGSAKLVTGSGASPKIESGTTGLSAVTPGQAVTVAGWLRADTARSLSLDVNWFNSAGVYQSTSNAQITTVVANTWTYFTGTVTVPAGISYADMAATNQGTPGAGLTLWLDDALLITGIVGGFADTASFEGGTVGAWVGVNGAVVNNTAYQAHDGTRSMLVTWPTAASGAAWVGANIPPTRTGVTYAYSAWVYVPAGSPPVVLNCNGNISAASAVTNAWTRLSVSWTANDTIGAIFVVTAGASTAGQTCYVDSVQLEVASSASTFTTSGPTVFPVWNGYVERYNETWQHAGQYGWVKTTSVDALGILARGKLADCMTADALQDNPAFYWPLSDAPKNAVFCQPRPPFQGTVSINQFVISGTARPTDYTMGASGGPGLDQINCVQFNAGGDSQPQAYFGASNVSYADYNINDVGSGITWEAWFQTTTASTMVIVEVIADSLETLDIAISAAGNVVANSYSAAGPTRYTITDSGVCNDGAWHYVAVTEKSSGGTVTATLTVDQRIVGTGTYSSPTAMQSEVVCLAFGTYAPATQYVGKMARVAVYPTALSTARRFSHWASGRGFPWDSTGQRASRILGWVPWLGPTSIDAGATDVSPASSLAGITAADAINACSITENGPFVATPDGKVNFWGRDRYYLKTTPTAVFGENTGAGEIPYLGDVQIDTDPQLIYNDITVTAQGGVAQEVFDLLSQRRYGVATGTASTVHRFDGDAMRLAQHLLRRYKEPQPRASVITLDLGANPGIWAKVLALRFGDRVRVNRRSAAATTTVEGYIDEIKNTGDPGQRHVQIRVAPADPFAPFILGDATYGVLGTSVMQY